MNNGDLAVNFAWIRDQLKENRKGTNAIKRAIECCSFSIQEFYEKYGSLQDASVGEEVGIKTLKILELLLKHSTKEEALKEYRLIRKKH